MSLKHKLFEFLVRCALILLVVIALVAFLIKLQRQIINLDSWLILTLLIVRSVLVCLLKLGANLIV